MTDTDEILTLLGLDGNIILKNPIRGTKGITINSMINSIITYGTIIDASISLGYTSDGPLKACISNILIPFFQKDLRSFLKEEGQALGEVHY